MPLSAPQVVSCTLLYHELYYLAISGADSLTLSFFPAIPQLRSHCFLRVAALLTTAGNALFPTFVSPFVVLCMVVIYALIHNRRVSNHMVGAFFYLLADLVYSADGTQGGTALVVLVPIYIFAAFHKLNRDFLSPERSCANVFVDGYLSEKWDIRLSSFWLRAVLPPVTILTEFAIGFGLLGDAYTRLVAFGLAAVLHVLFGISGNAHFSVFALLALGSFALPQTGIVLDVASCSIIAACVIGAPFACNLHPFRVKSVAVAATLLFGLVVGLFLCIVRSYCDRATSLEHALQRTSISYGHAVIGLALVANCAAPYFGKTEFSFAMFSNLRPDLDNHLIISTYGRRRAFQSRFLQILGVSDFDILRSHPSYTVQRVAADLSAIESRTYNVEYILAVLRLFRHCQLDSCTLRVELPSKETLTLRASSSELALRKLAHSAPRALLANAYPPFLSNNSEPYLG